MIIGLETLPHFKTFCMLKFSSTRGLYPWAFIIGFHQVQLRSPVQGKRVEILNPLMLSGNKKATHA